MKKIFYLFVLFVSTQMFSQNIESLKTKANQAYKASAEMDFDKILELTYPKLFSIMPKESLKEIIKQTFEGNPEFKIKMIAVEPNFNFSEIKKIDGQTFCVIKHNNALEMVFTNKISDPNAVTDLFKSSMKADDVTYNAEKNSILIKLISTMIAVADDSTKNEWTFLNNDNDGQLMTLLFSEKIKKELGL
ncbi:hypothetical protein [Flavobacterium luminosum]|uniref:DUF4252 domain-containing protein n=1 Tax=Flavobacterium luminosum TaxID=2949086 RepID=A0ABT0TMQ2_9FLAO|nr:hypothetical protein [Flavobacterium sp. HXWNR70]MCL9808379.1 hypothetical protein [Flavobacterium sp. HXWNR70]